MFVLFGSKLLRTCRWTLSYSSYRVCVRVFTSNPFDQE